jgi:hypothetical protein
MPSPHRRQIPGVLAAVMGLMILGGCEYPRPTAATPPPPPPKPAPKPDVEGLWRGDITVAECTRKVGGGPDPCEARRGRTEPLVLNVEHLDVAIPNADLRVVVSAFEPAAQGACYGTRETGSIFFQGVLRRTADQFDVPLTFRGQLDGNRIDSLEEIVDVNVTMRTSVGVQLLGERWKFSPILRQSTNGS